MSLVMAGVSWDKKIVAVGDTYVTNADDPTRKVRPVGKGLIALAGSYVDREVTFDYFLRFANGTRGFQESYYTIRALRGIRGCPLGTGPDDDQEHLFCGDGAIQVGRRYDDLETLNVASIGLEDAWIQARLKEYDPDMGVGDLKELFGKILKDARRLSDGVLIRGKQVCILDANGFHEIEYSEN
jgi:hypothetical protein